MSRAVGTLVCLIPLHAPYHFSCGFVFHSSSFQPVFKILIHMAALQKLLNPPKCSATSVPWLPKQHRSFVAHTPISLALSQCNFQRGRLILAVCDSCASQGRTRTFRARARAHGPTIRTAHPSSSHFYPRRRIHHLPFFLSSCGRTARTAPAPLAAHPHPHPHPHPRPYPHPRARARQTAPLHLA